MLHIWYKIYVDIFPHDIYALSICICMQFQCQVNIFLFLSKQFLHWKGKGVNYVFTIYKIISWYQRCSYNLPKSSCLLSTNQCYFMTILMINETTKPLSYWLYSHNLILLIMSIFSHKKWCRCTRGLFNYTRTL